MDMSIWGPFPPCQVEVSAYQESIIRRIEQGIVPSRPVLVEMSRRPQEVENLGAMLIYIDRVLSYTTVSKILLVAEPKSEMLQLYQEWVSLETYQYLQEKHSMQDMLFPSMTASVSIVSSDEVTRATQSWPEMRGAFDMIVVSGFSFDDPPWGVINLVQSLEQFETPYRIVFSHPELLDVWRLLLPSCSVLYDTPPVEKEKHNRKEE